MKKLIAPVLICALTLTACGTTTVETHEASVSESTAMVTAETTVVETTVETIVETESTEVEETEPEITEPAETNLNGAAEIVPGDDLTEGYWHCNQDYQSDDWDFTSSHPDIDVPGYSSTFTRLDNYALEQVFSRSYDYHIYEDNTLYAYIRSQGSLTGDCFVYSYSLDGDCLTLTEVCEIGPDGTVYEDDYPETFTFMRMIEDGDGSTYIAN